MAPPPRRRWRFTPGLRLELRLRGESLTNPETETHNPPPPNDSYTPVCQLIIAAKSSSPMSNRNFPPSFWNSNYVHPIPAPTHHQVSDLYGTATDTGYATDPWVPHAAAAHYGSYAHAAHAHAAHAHAYHHNMAQYGSLLRLPQQYASHGSRLHHDQQTAHALEYSSYPTMAGLEAQVAQVQESSKDLYWF
ncbi:hypothetical protein M5D96_008523 [Drosophila gunungcola]|uniref:Uncharacterized protein n=1 Tax=Drosophila gunungcola TaxID=103775 RepID=A0A9Q0BP11_9MUSC|nr:hypothetical protein M5D96_008523 [Drosophila gunungcola]